MKDSRPVYNPGCAFWFVALLLGVLGWAIILGSLWWAFFG